MPRAGVAGHAGRGQDHRSLVPSQALTRVDAELNKRGTTTAPDARPDHGVGRLAAGVHSVAVGAEASAAGTR